MAKQKKTALGLNDAQAMSRLKLNEFLLSRSALARAMGVDGKKNINESCGYPDEISAQDYRLMYEREGVAKRTVNIYPQECWALDPEVVESQDEEETAFEKEWKALQSKHNLYSVLQRADKLSGVGMYGIVLLGFNDGKDMREAMVDMDKNGEYTKTTKKLKLNYIRVFDESVLQIDSYENDTSHPRFGLPTQYSIKFQEIKQGVSTPEVKQRAVHWSRVIHIADNVENSVIFGEPRMKQVFNRLIDIRKTCGGSGEMFWKGGFPGLSFELAPGQEAANVTVDKASVKQQIEAYENGLQRYLAVEGLTTKSLAPQVADPGPHFEMYIKYICSSLGIPYRIFIGSEQAQLASGQDTRTWNTRLKCRQDQHITPNIIRQLVDRFMAVGVISPVDEYFVNWPDLNTKSAEDNANVAAKMTQALAAYASSGVEQYVPFYDYCIQILGFDAETAEALDAAREEHLDEMDEDSMFEDPAAIADEAAAKAAGVAVPPTKGKRPGVVKATPKKVKAANPRAVKRPTGRK